MTADLNNNLLKISRYIIDVVSVMNVAKDEIFGPVTPLI
jgi:hypothetical protein|tara:strand:+ start:1212 stop:1328 length:117 start_codon:yes stop_codon:yes gene_type:complete